MGRRIVYGGSSLMVKVLVCEPRDASSILVYRPKRLLYVVLALALACSPSVKSVPQELCACSRFCIGSTVSSMEPKVQNGFVCICADGRQAEIDCFKEQ